MTILYIFLSYTLLLPQHFLTFEPYINKKVTKMTMNIYIIVNTFLLPQHLLIFVQK